MNTDIQNTIELAATGQTEVERAEPHVQPPGNTADDSTLLVEPTPPVKQAPAKPTPSSDESRVDTLVVKADKLYKESEKTRKQLLDQRVELGRVLNELKDAVGHGKFIDAFKDWNKTGKISFCLKTAQRAMAYAVIEEQGKFVNAAKIDIVSNLADAERIRKAEAKKAKDAEKAAKQETATPENEPGAGGEDLRTLPKSQINTKAGQIIKPLLDECDAYDAETKRELLEELIELLTKKLEQ